MPLPFEVLPEMRIFSGQHLDRLEAAVDRQQRFAYYTSAATAALILQNEELWLRLPSVMNDFSETELGLGLLGHSLTSGQGQRVVAALNKAFAGLGNELLAHIVGPDPRRLFANTFIACVSEHDEDREGQNGRLSMWRAYGGVSGVALIFSVDVFAGDADLGVYSSAVEYVDPGRFEQLIGEFANRLEAGVHSVQALGRDVAKLWAFEAAQLAILNVKHPAFLEEREWRLFRLPQDPLGPSLRREIVIIEGVPQPVLKFHMPGLTGFIEKIIVGPTEFPVAVGSALHQCLVEKGISGAGDRIQISGVPLRPQRR